MDSGTIVTIVVAGATLLLTVPVTLLTNLMTPKVKDWWATTSEKARLARIEELKKDIKLLSDFGRDDALEVLGEAGIFFAFGCIGSVFLILCCTSYISEGVRVSERSVMGFLYAALHVGTGARSWPDTPLPSLLMLAVTTAVAMLTLISFTMPVGSLRHLLPTWRNERLKLKREELSKLIGRSEGASPVDNRH